MKDEKVLTIDELVKKELNELVMDAEDQEPVKEPEDARNYGSVSQPVLTQSSFKWRILSAFWIFGLCNNYGYVVMLSAAHDILARESETNGTTTPNPTNDLELELLVDSTARHCNLLSTGAILLADIIPALLTKLIIPFFPLAVHVRMVLMLVLACAGFILVGVSETQWLAIAGVVCTAFSSGIGEATMLAYMPFFTHNVIGAWSSGTGGAGIFGSFSYAFLISLGLSPSTTMYVMLIVPAIMAVTFWGLLVRPNVRYAGESSEGNEASHISEPTNSDNHIPQTFTNETFSEKVKFIPSLFKYMVPIGLVYFFEYFINQGLFELIQFDNTFLSPSEQYRWFQVDYQIGVFLSRSSIYFFHIKPVWILAVLQGVNMVLFGLEAVFSFTPYFAIVLVAVLWEGLLGGGAYVNTFHRINTEVPPEKREFSMAITTVADSIGITLAGFLSMPAHNYICTLPK